MKISRMAILLLLAIGAVSLGGCGGSLVGAKNELAGMEAPIGNAAVASQTSGTATRPDLAGTARLKKRALTRKTQKSDTAYYIGVLDVLDISVFKVKELTKSVQVADTGTINFPLVGEVQAVGKTAQQLELSLTRKLGAKYLENPQVTVFVKEYNSQQATVSGSVMKPGVFPIRGKTTLVSIIARAGGLHESSDSIAVIARDVNGKRTAARFDISAIAAGKANDPVIRGEDKIVVGHSAVKAAYNNIMKAVPLIGKFALFL